MGCDEVAEDDSSLQGLVESRCWWCSGVVGGVECGKIVFVPIICLEGQLLYCAVPLPAHFYRLCFAYFVLILCQDLPHVNCFRSLTRVFPKHFQVD